MQPSASPKQPGTFAPSTDVMQLGREIALLAALLAAGLLILAVVATWLILIGLAGDQALQRSSAALLGADDLRTRWSIEQCFLFGVGTMWPVVALARRWLASSADPEAAAPVGVLGVGIRPGPVAIASGVLCGVLVLAVWASTVGLGESSWRGAVVVSAAACSAVLVWRAGATLAVVGRRAWVLWVVAALIAASCVGGPLHL